MNENSLHLTDTVYKSYDFESMLDTLYTWSVTGITSVIDSHILTSFCSWKLALFQFAVWWDLR